MFIVFYHFKCLEFLQLLPFSLLSKLRILLSSELFNNCLMAREFILSLLNVYSYHCQMSIVIVVIVRRLDLFSLSNV